MSYVCSTESRYIKQQERAEFNFISILQKLSKHPIAQAVQASYGIHVALPVMRVAEPALDATYYGHPLTGFNNLRYASLERIDVRLRETSCVNATYLQVREQFPSVRG